MAPLEEGIVMDNQWYTAGVYDRYINLAYLPHFVRQG
jgi:hypothetical protein